MARDLEDHYDRVSSRVMVRVLEHPDRAALDYAAYDRNCVFHYPLRQALTARPGSLRLADLHFGGALVSASIVDRMAATPLTAAEQKRGLAWRPLLQRLGEWNYDASEKLLEAGARVSAEHWGNRQVVQPLQTIAAAFLHGDAMWVRVDFRPEVTWLPCTDSDGDKYPEIFARIDPRCCGKAMLKAIRTSYMGRELSVPEMEQAFYEIASDWYPSLMTVVLEAKDSRPWPTAATEPDIRALFAGRRFAAPLAVLRSKPYGTALYNVFLLHGSARRASGSAAPVAAAAADRPAAVDGEKADGSSVAEELARWGGGDWQVWVRRLEPFYRAVRQKLAARPEEWAGLIGREGFLFFRGDVEYLVSGELRGQEDGRDPFPAILDFAEQLRERHIGFLLVVIPSKAEVYPDKLVSEAPPGAQPYVAPYGRKLLGELLAAGVPCVDLLPTFIEHRYDPEGLLYMPQDTHWTPRGLELAASLIAERVRQSAWYKARKTPPIVYRTRTVVCKRTGDIRAMLTEREQVGYRPMTVTAHQVVDPDGKLYTDSRDSPFVVLGDSFTGVFHFEDCRHAGLSAHLACELGLGVDLIMAHGSGPRIRGRLARRGHQELARKRFVVWTVAARDLYHYWAPWACIKLP